MNKYAEYKEAYKAMIKEAVSSDNYKIDYLSPLSKLKKSDIKKQVDLDKNIDQFDDGPENREHPVSGSILGALLGSAVGLGLGGLGAGAMENTSLGRGFFDSNPSAPQLASLLIGTGLGGVLGGIKGHSIGTAKLSPWLRVDQKINNLASKLDTDENAVLNEQKELMDKMIYYINNTKDQEAAKSLRSVLWMNGWL